MAALKIIALDESLTRERYFCYGITGAAAGMAVDGVNQVIAGKSFDPVRSLTQAAVGGVAGAAGNSIGLARSLAQVKNGASVKSALDASAVIAGVTAVSVGNVNVAITSELGGSLRRDNECECVQ